MSHHRRCHNLESYTHWSLAHQSRLRSKKIQFIRCLQMNLFFSKTLQGRRNRGGGVVCAPPQFFGGVGCAEYWTLNNAGCKTLLNAVYIISPEQVSRFLPCTLQRRSYDVKMLDWSRCYEERSRWEVEPLVLVVTNAWCRPVMSIDTTGMLPFIDLEYGCSFDLSRLWFGSSDQLTRLDSTRL